MCDAYWDARLRLPVNKQCHRTGSGPRDGHRGHSLGDARIPVHIKMRNA